VHRSIEAIEMKALIDPWIFQLYLYKKRSPLMGNHFNITEYDRSRTTFFNFPCLTSRLHAYSTKDRRHSHYSHSAYGVACPTPTYAKHPTPLSTSTLHFSPTTQSTERTEETRKTIKQHRKVTQKSTLPFYPPI